MLFQTSASGKIRRESPLSQIAGQQLSQQLSEQALKNSVALQLVFVFVLKTVCVLKKEGELNREMNARDLKQPWSEVRFVGMRQQLETHFQAFGESVLVSMP